MPVSRARFHIPTMAGEVVWILTCEDHTYRVRLRPDMAALIEQVD
ncbi:hypothetical protein [Kaustia mangrovi]|nr:hypothetical protein [Kaustia mangrovi]